MIAALVSGFALGGLSSMPIAGAVSVFVCRRGLAGQVLHGLALAAGAALGESTWCFLVLIGADRLFDRWPLAITIAQSAGGLLLLALGIFFLVHHVSRPSLGEDGGPVLPRLRDEFRFGVTLTGANLTIPVNWLALSSLAISFGLHPHREPALFAAGVALGIVTWFAILLKLISRVRHRLHSRVMEWLPHLLGILLVVGGLAALARIWL
jgi:threonine/homoserine/homoserine lactone efflux protein